MKNKRNKMYFMSGVFGILTLLSLLLYLFVIKENWMCSITIGIFSFYAFFYGYVKGWDANKKPSTLKGP